MDWQIKTIARKSSLSEQVFNSGDEVISLIYVSNDDGELARDDLLAAEADGFEVQGDLLGRWARILKDPEASTVSASEQMASAEGFFLSLYQNNTEAAEAESNALKHLLALMLERKRVLRAVGPRMKQGEQRYLHTKQKQEYLVPVVEISSDLMLRIQDTLGELIL